MIWITGSANFSKFNTSVGKVLFFHQRGRDLSVVNTAIDGRFLPFPSSFSECVSLSNLHRTFSIILTFLPYIVLSSKFSFFLSLFQQPRPRNVFTIIFSSQQYRLDKMHDTTHDKLQNSALSTLQLILRKNVQTLY